jgi:DNA-binding CsgD family transcriptional regulator
VPRSGQLRTSDIRALYELAAELRDLGDDPLIWWPHFGERLAKLTDAQFAGCGEVKDVASGKVETLGIGEWGWENGFDREPWLASVQNFDKDPAYNEPNERYFKRLAEQDGICLARTDLLTDSEWKRSWAFRELNEPMGVDHYLWCYRSLPRIEGHHALVVLCRSLGQRDFSQRDKSLVQAAHAIISPNVGGALTGYQEPSPSSLSPRVRLVLQCLLEGDSDKQVATRLGITRHTVNQYIKTIFGHFAVTSRAELLARWIKRGWGSRFEWLDVSP